MEKISKDMTIQEIFYNFGKKKEALAQVLMDAGLSCMGCAASQFETLEQGLMAHGKSEEEVVSVLNNLNSIL